MGHHLVWCCFPLHKGFLRLLPHLPMLSNFLATTKLINFKTF